jgi:hypothetical protein
MLRRTASPQLGKGGGNPDADAPATQFKPEYAQELLDPLTATYNATPLTTRSLNSATVIVGASVRGNSKSSNESHPGTSCTTAASGRPIVTRKCAASRISPRWSSSSRLSNRSSIAICRFVRSLPGIFPCRPTPGSGCILVRRVFVAQFVVLAPQDRGNAVRRRSADVAICWRS